MAGCFTVSEAELGKLLLAIVKILERGNDAEIKRTRDGVVLLEVCKTRRGALS